MYNKKKFNSNIKERYNNKKNHNKKEYEMCHE